MHLPISDKIELNILHQNSHQAEKNKVKFNNYNLLCLNIMSSPGAGKTRLLEITLEDLSKKFQSAVLEGDMTTNLDAARLEKLNIPFSLLHKELRKKSIKVNNKKKLGSYRVEQDDIVDVFKEFKLIHKNKAARHKARLNSHIKNI